MRHATAALILLWTLPAHACDLPHPPADLVKSSGGDYWAGPALSGAWFDPARNGEGIILEMLPDGRALMIWFTFPPAGEPGEQAWLLAQDGRVDENRIRFEQVVRPQGGRFGAGFDPGQVVLEPWGSLELRFDDCRHAQASWSGPAAWGSGNRALERLSMLDELDCEGQRKLTETGARDASGLRSRSGAWFVPERSGEGWIVEELADGRNIVYWFTYTPDGRQAWTVGSAQRNGTRLSIEQNLIARGTRFGEGFDPAAVELIDWGRLEFDFQHCHTASVSYQSLLPGWGEAQHNAARITVLAGAPCRDSLPQTPTGLSWTERAPTPPFPQSELAVTRLGDALYALGGFGATRAFRRFDALQNSWSTLPDLPAGRDHLAAFAIDGGVYMVGGAANGGGDQSISAYRYDLAQGNWEARPELGFIYGSHAAVLHGHAYIGDANGSLLQYDPLHRRVRYIPPPLPLQRDHAQVVAFLDEIWVIAGRFPETFSIAIYDPAGDRWRFGPAVQRVRGGFAAAVVGDHIVIAGGEVLAAPAYIEPSTEIYSAGQQRWQFGPDLPVPVHGVAAGALGNRFVLVSGSTIVGSMFGATGRVFELALPD